MVRLSVFVFSCGVPSIKVHPYYPSLDLDLGIIKFIEYYLITVVYHKINKMRYSSF